MQTKVGIRIADNMIKMYDFRICYYVEIREYFEILRKLQWSESR